MSSSKNTNKEYIGKTIRYLAPFAIVAIVAIFIYNVYTHGRITHPGKATYINECAQCHGDDGEGIRTLVPPLINADIARTHLDSIPCWLKFGMNHAITVNGVEYDQPMYPLELDEIQTANVINFINAEFLYSDREVNSAWVKKKWEECN